MRAIQQVAHCGEERTPRPDLRLGPDTVSLLTVRGWSERFLSLGVAGNLILTRDRSLLRAQTEWRLVPSQIAFVQASDDGARLRFTDVDQSVHEVRLDEPQCSTQARWIAALDAAHFTIASGATRNARAQRGLFARSTAPSRRLLAGVESPFAAVDLAAAIDVLRAAAAPTSGWFARGRFCRVVAELSSATRRAAAAEYAGTVFDLALGATAGRAGSREDVLALCDAAAAFSMVSTAHKLARGAIDALFNALCARDGEVLRPSELERYLCVVLALMHPCAGRFGDPARRSVVARAMARRALRQFATRNDDGSDSDSDGSRSAR